MFTDVRDQTWAKRANQGQEYREDVEKKEKKTYEEEVNEKKRKRRKVYPFFPLNPSDGKKKHILLSVYGFINLSRVIGFGSPRINKVSPERLFILLDSKAEETQLSSGFFEMRENR